MPKKILVIDDNKETVMSLNFALEKAGYQVDYAYDGQEGYLKAIDFKPDLIILDIMMPVMDGFTMNRHLKENPQTRSIPVIVITAKSGSLPPPASERSVPGIDAYLRKPFFFNEILMKIREILQSK
jgi:two-component system alkaline phosphatase synthesis response regulator PhoP